MTSSEKSTYQTPAEVSPTVRKANSTRRSSSKSHSFILTVASFGILVAGYSFSAKSAELTGEFTGERVGSSPADALNNAPRREFDRVISKVESPSTNMATEPEVATTSSGVVDVPKGVPNESPLQNDGQAVVLQSGAVELPAAQSETDEPEYLENSLGMKFIPIGGGVSFCIWPTRLRDFELFAAETKLASTSWKVPGFRQTPEHPVVNVTWQEAANFCEWLTERDRKLGLLGAAELYRLPTDLEWSRAVGLPEEEGGTPEARDMGNREAFPWGRQWPPPPGSGNYAGEETQSAAAIKGYEDAFIWTSPTGSFAPNSLGLYDMGGNVWQWCADNWDRQSSRKLLRGASWSSGAPRLGLLASCRIPAGPDTAKEDYGFRVVRAGDPLRTTRR